MITLTVRPMIRDALRRLVYVYPLLHDQRLAELDLVRDFLAAHFLKAIKVSDLLHHVNYIVLSPPGSKVSPSASSSTSTPQGQTSTVSQDQGTRESYIMRERLMYLKKLLEHDPEIIKLRPQMDLIVHGEFVLPVVVGTAPFPVHPFFLWLFLTLATLARIPLDTVQGIRRVATLVQAVPNDKLYEAVEREKLALWQKRTSGPRQPPLLDYLVRQKRTETSRLVSAFQRMLDPVGLYDYLDLEYRPTEQKIQQQTQVRFRLDSVLEDAVLSLRRRLAGNYDRILTSVSYVFFPKGSDLDYVGLREALAEELENGFRRWLDDRLEMEMSDLSRRLVEGEADIHQIMRLGNQTLDAVQRTDQLLENNFSNRFLPHPAFDTNELLNFLSSIEAAVSPVRARVKDSLDFLARLFSDIRRHYPELERLAQRSAGMFLHRHLEGVSRSEIGDIAVLGTLQNQDQRVLQTLVRDFTRALTELLTYLLVASLVEAVASNLETLRLDYRLRRTEVTTFPNFTIVLDEALLRSIMTVLQYRTFFDFLAGASRLAKPGLMDTSPKAAISHLTTVLRIPNMVVVGKNKIHYRFMHMGQIADVTPATAERYINFVKSQ